MGVKCLLRFLFMEWFNEVHKNQRSFGMKVSQVHYHKRSGYQDILIFENEDFGTVMALDGAYMLSDLDEHMYHKSLTTYGMQNLSPSASELNILVIGAGDGGIVRDLIHNWNSRIKKITMVEIDADVIEVSKQFFPQIASEFQNPKLDLLVQDALAFIKSAPEKSFDLILCDSTDPEGFAAGLIEEDFYRDIKRVMKNDGIFCAQSGSPIFMREELDKTQANLAKVFPDQHSYLAPMLVYPGAIWSYTAAGAKILNRENLDLSEFVSLKQKVIA
jgi:spermidine synthase